MGAGKQYRERNLALKRCEWYEVPHYWDDIEKWIVSALANGNSLTLTEQDIYDQLLARKMQLWLAIWDRPAACAVTKISRHKRVTICEMLIVGGAAIREWLHFEKAVAEWAKEQGCDVIEGSGRPGWERKAKDYKPVYTVFRKVL